MNPWRTSRPGYSLKPASEADALLGIAIPKRISATPNNWAGNDLIELIIKSIILAVIICPLIISRMVRVAPILGITKLLSATKHAPITPPKYAGAGMLVREYEKLKPDVAKTRMSRTRKPTR